MGFAKHPLFLAVAFTAFGLLISLIAANLLPERRELREALPHNLASSDEQFRISMGSLFGSNNIPGNAIETLVNGDEIFPSMLKAIEGAKNTITFETYIYWSGEIADRFADVLAAKAKEGVSVKVLLDWVGSIPMEPRLIDKMKQAGVEIVRFRPIHWYTLDRINNRTHRKLLIVDGRIGFTGGVGIGDEWKGDATSPSEWRDNHYRIEGPAVSELQAAFAEHWIEATGELLMGDRFFPVLKRAGDKDAQVVVSSTHHRNVMHLMLMTALAAAEKSIRIGTPYFVPDEVTTQQLLAARRRGVDVQVIVPGAETDARVVRKASRHFWGELLEAGVRIHEFQPTMYHSKIVILDEIWTSVGSTNIDERALRLNDETNINFYDRDFARSQIALFEADLTRSREYTLAEWQARPFTQKITDWAASLLRSQI